jgi:hypothetical protein
MEIRNRWTGQTQFMAEIECDEDASWQLKIGLAVRWALRTNTDLTGANLTCADLTGANLTCAKLTGAELTCAKLRDAKLMGANLTCADLTGAKLRDAKLMGAKLTCAKLRSADFTGVPVIKNIHRKVFAAASQDAALDMSVWHTCETTHCLAGWVTTLAGDAGQQLEELIGTDAAAMLIYMASDPDLGRLPDFYCDNASALADMKLRAEIEASKSPAAGGA